MVVIVIVFIVGIGVIAEDIVVGVIAVAVTVIIDVIVDVIVVIVIVVVVSSEWASIFIRASGALSRVEDGVWETAGGQASLRRLALTWAWEYGAGRADSACGRRGFLLHLFRKPRHAGPWTPDAAMLRLIDASDMALFRGSWCAVRVRT